MNAIPSPENDSTREAIRTREQTVHEMAVRAGALDALESTTPVPELQASDVLPYLEALLVDQAFIELKAVVAAIYGRASVPVDEFAPVYDAVAILLEQHRLQKVGHGFYVTPERYNQHPHHTSRKKIIRKLSYRPATLAAIYWDLHEQAPSARTDEVFVDLVVTLQRLVDEGVLAVEEQASDQRHAPLRLYRLVLEGEAVKPAPDIKSTAPTVMSESGYPITYSGGPPEIELQDAMPLHIKDLYGAKSASQKDLPGHSVNNKTGRKGGAANTHSPKRRR